MSRFTSARRAVGRALRVVRPKDEGKRMNRLSLRRLLRSLLASSLILLLVGCAPQPRADLTIINGGEPETLDPAIVTGVSEMRITKALFEGLVKLDPVNARPIPGLAERWEKSTDGRTYTFFLRTNAAWSTGEPITARDVVWSWLRALDPTTGGDYAGQLFYIRNAEDFNSGKIKDPAQVGVRALDDHTVRVELNSPVAFFPDMCAFPTLAVVPRQTIERFGERWLKARPLPASGPYQLEAWRLNDKVRLRKNPRYYAAAATQTELIDLLPTGSPNTALNLYETGVADIIWDKDLMPTELMDLLRERPDFHSFSYLGGYFIRFNVTRKPFTDPRVRQALAMAIDKALIVRKITRAGETPATHFTPDGTANADPPDGLPYDPERARRLLAEAGFPGGKDFPRVAYAFDASGGGAAKLNAKIAVELQQMWRAVLGIEIELRQIERKIFFNSQSRLDYDLSRSSWVGDYNDPNTFLDLFTSTSGNNRTGWKNSRYDALLHEANQQTDLKRRAEIFRTAETLLLCDEAPIVPLYFYAGLNAYDPRRISGIYPNLLDEHPLQAIRKSAATPPPTSSQPASRAP